MLSFNLCVHGIFCGVFFFIAVSATLSFALNAEFVNKVLLRKGVGSYVAWGTGESSCSLEDIQSTGSNKSGKRMHFYEAR